MSSAGNLELRLDLPPGFVEMVRSDDDASVEEATRRLVDDLMPGADEPRRAEVAAGYQQTIADHRSAGLDLAALKLVEVDGALETAHLAAVVLPMAVDAEGRGVPVEQLARGLKRKHAGADVLLAPLPGGSSAVVLEERESRVEGVTGRLAAVDVYVVVPEHGVMVVLTFTSPGEERLAPLADLAGECAASVRLVDHEPAGARS